MGRLDQLTPGQAQYVLGRVVADKKIRAREIDKYLGEMDQEIRSLENRLSMLREAQGAAESAGPAAAAQKAPRKRRRGRKKGRKGSGDAEAGAQASSTATAGKSRKGRKRSSKAQGAAKTGKKRGSRKATTPEAQKSRQLQGQYISLIKRFSGREKEKYQKMASDKGREEAVKQMKAAIGK